MMDEEQVLRTLRPFRGAPWGPVELIDRRFLVTVRVGDGAEIGLDCRDRRTSAERDAEPWLTPVNLGLPVLSDRRQVATITGSRSEAAGIVRPGRLRVEGEAPFDQPGLRLRGHLLPQRLTLEDAAGSLVWTPPVLGWANAHAIGLLACRPRLAERARPEHVALWLAAWWKLLGDF